MGYVLIRKGQNTEALTEAEKGAEQSKGANRNLIGLVYALAASGRRSEALAIIREFEDKYSKRQSDATEIAGGYAGLGEKGHAFEWLEKAFVDRSSLLVALRVDPSFGPLRDDPRFKNLLKRMNLPE